MGKCLLIFHWWSSFYIFLLSLSLSLPHYSSPNIFCITCLSLIPTYCWASVTIKAAAACVKNPALVAKQRPSAGRISVCLYDFHFPNQFFCNKLLIYKDLLKGRFSQTIAIVISWSTPIIISIIGVFLFSWTCRLTLDCLTDSFSTVFQRRLSKGRKYF